MIRLFVLIILFCYSTVAFAIDKEKFCKIIKNYQDKSFQTSNGLKLQQLRRWNAIDRDMEQMVEENYKEIERDMNNRNSTAKRKKSTINYTRKRREELSISASKTIKKEKVEIIVKFD